MDEDDTASARVWGMVAPPTGLDFPPTVANLIHDAARRHGEAELLVMGERRISFRDAERISGAWARGLLALGVGKASRVGILMPNAPDWPLAFFAAARAGALSVSLSTFYQPPELDWAVRHNDLDTLLIAARYLGADYLERLERALPGLAEHDGPELYLPQHPYLRRIVVWGDCDRPWALKGPDALLAAAAARPKIDEAFLAAVEAEITPADLLVVICTSGSTAEPKAVVHTHGAALRAAWQFLDHIDVRPGERTYTGQPFFWIGGLNVNLLPSLYVGACLCFSPSPRPSDILDVIERERVTRLSLWAPQAGAIAEAARAENRDVASVRTGLGPRRDLAGEIIPPDRRAGGIMGMTESFGMHSIEPLTSPAPPGKAGSWGRGLKGVDRKIIDARTGAEQPPGVEGELYIRGHTLMQGYYKREREEVFTRDGFFATGDLCSIDDDGYIWFHARLGEMIKTSGANVAPREVEAALATCPGVREAIVFGAPCPIRGQSITAVVVAAFGATLEAETLKTLLRERISAYKIPHDFVFMASEDIPRTGSDKVRKGELARLLAERKT